MWKSSSSIFNILVCVMFTCCIFPKEVMFHQINWLTWDRSYSSKGVLLDSGRNIIKLSSIICCASCTQRQWGPTANFSHRYPKRTVFTITEDWGNQKTVRREEGEKVRHENLDNLLFKKYSKQWISYYYFSFINLLIITAHIDDRLFQFEVSLWRG